MEGSGTIGRLGGCPGAAGWVARSYSTTETRGTAHFLLPAPETDLRVARTGGEGVKKTLLMAVFTLLGSAGIPGPFS